MSEIYVATEFTHPAERIWRALTDRELLTRWLAGTEISPLTGSSFRIRLVKLPGLDAPIESEVVEADRPRRLVMRWQQEQRQTLVTAELVPGAEDCQLIFRESLETGDWAPEQQELREQSYQRVFTVQLPAVLDWIAFREQNFRADDTAELPAVVDQSRAGRRTRHIAAAIAAVILGGAGILAVVVFWLTGTAPRGATAENELPVIIPTATSGAATPTARSTASSRRPTPTTTPSRTPGMRTASAAKSPDRPSLAAEYQTVASGLFSYTGKIVLRNTGKAAAANWVVTVTLPGSAKVSHASGATFQQKGQTVTFTGDPVTASGSASFQFDVADGDITDKKPASCTVGGKPCTGL